MMIVEEKEREVRGEERTTHELRNVMVNNGGKRKNGKKEKVDPL